MQVTPNKTFKFAPLRSAGRADARRLILRYMLLDPNEKFKFLVINPAQ